MTFDENSLFRKFLPDPETVTPINFSLMMYSFLDSENREQYGAGKKKTIETVLKYSRRITDAINKLEGADFSDNDVDEKDEEEIKESFKRKRKAVYQKKMEEDDITQKTDRHYVKDPQ